MGKRTSILLPSTAARLRRFGERLRIARLRRRIAVKHVADRAGMSPMTLRSLERGGQGVTIGAYLAVLQVLGMDEDLDLVARDDSIGRSLQDARLLTTSSAKPRKEAIRAQTKHRRIAKAVQTAGTIRAPGDPDSGASSEDTATGTGDWAESGGFLTSDALASAIDQIPPTAKKRR
ncbi:MAG: helix-turn-helix domain-containing protein [Acidobacteria bacterium]|nr:helix-turn-helix domain-containing protein [Acidobacteriota bacterium]